jgi:hypothetical protein
MIPETFMFSENASKIAHKREDVFHKSPTITNRPKARRKNRPQERKKFFTNRQIAQKQEEEIAHKKNKQKERRNLRSILPAHERNPWVFAGI